MAAFELSDPDRLILIEALSWMYNHIPDSGPPDWGPIEKHHQIERLQKRLREAAMVCDVAIGHGPGHQSISECIVRGVHTEHKSHLGHYWQDDEIGSQTTTITRHTGPNREPVTKTYRLAFEPY